jgi:phage terminase large subunit
VSISIDRIQERLKVNPVTKEPRLYIHPQCKKLIWEMERYHYAEKRGDEEAEPVKEQDDAISAIRYIIIMHNKQQLQSKPLPIGLYNPIGTGKKPNLKWKEDAWKGIN